MKRTKTKEYDMVKSVLPSRGARIAKFRKDTLHRKNRHRNNMLCHQMALNVEGIDDIEEDLHRWDEPHRANISGYYDIVYERRDVDHLNHFIAWAWLKTAHLDQQDKMSWMRAHCPMGLLGYHAMSHLEPYLGYNPVATHDPKWDIPRRFWNFPNDVYKTHEELVTEYHEDLISMAYDGDRRTRFNNFLKKQYDYKLNEYRGYGFPIVGYSLMANLPIRITEKKWIVRNPFRRFEGKWDIEEFFAATKNSRNNYYSFLRDEAKRK